VYIHVVIYVTLYVTCYIPWREAALAMSMVPSRTAGPNPVTDVPGCSPMLPVTMVPSSPAEVMVEPACVCVCMCVIYRRC
jgi:hypothetical protein